MVDGCGYLISHWSLGALMPHELCQNDISSSCNAGGHSPGVPTHDFNTKNPGMRFCCIRDAVAGFADRSHGCIYSDGEFGMTDIIVDVRRWTNDLNGMSAMLIRAAEHLCSSERATATDDHRLVNAAIARWRRASSRLSRL